MAPPRDTKGNGSRPARLVDLDAARAARAETIGEPVIIRLGGRDFTCPAELPARFAVLAAEGDLEAAMRELFSDDDAEAFWAMRPSIEDLEVMAEGVAALYGVTLGKSPASPTS